MIEVIYKEEKQEAKENESVFSIPKNIRQMGLTEGKYRNGIGTYCFYGKDVEKNT